MSTKQEDSTKPHVVMVLQAAGTRTIGFNAMLRAGLMTDKFKVTVVSDSFPDNVSKQVRCKQIRTRNFRQLRRFAHVPNEIGFGLDSRKALEEIHARDKVDFVLCHSYSICCLVGLYFQKKYRTRCGMYMHGHIFSRPKGTYSELITAYYKWCAKRCYPQTDLIFALSKQQRSLAIQAEADPEKVHVIPNGIGLDQIGLTESMVHNRRDLFSKDTLSLLYLGRCSAEKGFDTTNLA